MYCLYLGSRGTPFSSSWSMVWSYLSEIKENQSKNTQAKIFQPLSYLVSVRRVNAGNSCRNVLFPFRSLLLHRCKYSHVVLVYVGMWAETQAPYLALKAYQGSGAFLCKASWAILKSTETAHYLTANLTIMNERSFTSPSWGQKAFAPGKKQVIKNYWMPAVCSWWQWGLPGAPSHLGGGHMPTLQGKKLGVNGWTFLKLKTADTTALFFAW